MSFKKASIICTSLGLGGVTATALTGAAFNGVFTSTPAKPKKPERIWPQDYKNICYKWVYYGPNTEGELHACQDKNSTVTGYNTPLKFYLWWLKGKWGEKDYGRWFEIEKISGVSDSNEISFVFKNKKVSAEEKKLKIPSQAMWLKKSVQDLVNTGKDLKDICKLNINRKSLTCENVGSENKTVTVQVQENTAYF